MTITSYYSVEVLKINYYAGMSGGFHIPVTAIIEFNAINYHDYAHFDDLRLCYVGDYYLHSVLYIKCSVNYFAYCPLRMQCFTVIQPPTTIIIGATSS